MTALNAANGNGHDAGVSRLCDIIARVAPLHPYVIETKTTVREDGTVIDTASAPRPEEQTEYFVTRVESSKAESIVGRLARDGAHVTLANGRLYVPPNRLDMLLIVDPRPYPAELGLLADVAARARDRKWLVEAERLDALAFVLGRLIATAQEECASKPETEWSNLANVMVEHFKPWILPSAPDDGEAT